MRKRSFVWITSALGALIGYGIGQALGWDGFLGLVLSFVGAFGGAYAGTYLSARGRTGD